MLVPVPTPFTAKVVENRIEVGDLAWLGIRDQGSGIRDQGSGISLVADSCSLPPAF
jgi:hypothetical protein